jgi:hypothetical protein
VALQDNAEFSLFQKAATLRVKKPDEVVTRHIFVAVVNDAQKNVVKHCRNRRFQEIEPRKDSDAITICFPHVERLAFEKLPTADEIRLAVLPGECLIVIQGSLIVQMVFSESARCSYVFIRR